MWIPPWLAVNVITGNLSSSQPLVHTSATTVPPGACPLKKFYYIEIILFLRQVAPDYHRKNIGAPAAGD